MLESRKFMTFLGERKINPLFPSQYILPRIIFRHSFTHSLLSFLPYTVAGLMESFYHLPFFPRYFCLTNTTKAGRYSLCFKVATTVRSLCANQTISTALGSHCIFSKGPGGLSLLPIKEQWKVCDNACSKHPGPC